MKSNLISIIKSLLLIMAFSGCNLSSQPTVPPGSNSAPLSDTDANAGASTSTADLSEDILILEFDPESQDPIYYWVNPLNGERELVNIDLGHFGFPISWSADGQDLLVNVRREQVSRGNLCLIHIDNPSQRCLTSAYGGQFDAAWDFARFHNTMWSPDGERLIFRTIDDHFHIINRDGSQEMDLGPDSQYLLWKNNNYVVLYDEMRVVDVHTGQTLPGIALPLSSKPENSRIGQVPIGWSPDDTYFIYADVDWFDDTGNPQSPKASIKMVDASGTVFEVVSEVNTFQASPDKLRIVYLKTLDSGERQFYLADLAVNGQHLNLSLSQEIVGMCGWSPDNRFVIFIERSEEYGDGMVIFDTQGVYPSITFRTPQCPWWRPAA